MIDLRQRRYGRPAAGARGRLVIDGVFSGGAVPHRGAAVALPGTGVKAILEVLVALDGESLRDIPHDEIN